MKLVVRLAVPEQVGSHVLAELDLAVLPQAIAVVDERQYGFFGVHPVIGGSGRFYQGAVGFLGGDLRQCPQHVLHRDPVGRVAHFDQGLIGRLVLHPAQALDQGVLPFLFGICQVPEYCGSRLVRAYGFQDAQSCLVQILVIE